jgi:eukaryotic-like serine/threonine-protein kinase
VKATWSTVIWETGRSRDLTGQSFGNFRAVKLLAEGGFGAVYLAEHAALGNLRVAVKVMHRHLSERDLLVKRFFNEAQAVAALNHDGIVRIFDAGWSEAGVPYLAMELLEGESLRVRLDREGRLAPALAVWLATRAAVALAAVHARGIVHRDLKPANLFLLPDARRSGHARVKLLDFGIAKLAAGQATADGLTLGGQSMGTPHYMPPEQWLAPEEADHRADLYALGAILHELLTGKPPFEASTVFELRYLHLEQPPPSPGARIPDLPPRLDALVRTCLAKRPKDRLGSAAALAAELRLVAASLGPQAPGPALRTSSGVSSVP